MSKKKNPPRENAFEKFPEPRTFPDQWDMSGVAGMPRTPMSVEPEENDRMETFPEPRTIPVKWDVSGLKK